MIGGQVSKYLLQSVFFHNCSEGIISFRVIESRNSAYPVGSTIFGQFGWRTHTIFNPSEAKVPIESYILPDFGEHSSSLGLGILGMPG